MRRILLIFLLILIYTKCKIPAFTEDKKELQNQNKTDQMIIDEKKIQFKEMLSGNRESGDIRGIWYMEFDDKKIMSNFLNENFKYSSGYCIQVSDDQKNAKIYFAITDKVFSVKIEKISDTKYAMIYGEKKRIFEVVNLPHFLNKDTKKLRWFFEDSRKFDPDKKSLQLDNGFNYFDYCTRKAKYECNVQGCLKDIKVRDNFNEKESQNSHGVGEDY